MKIQEKMCRAHRDPHPPIYSPLSSEAAPSFVWSCCSSLQGNTASWAEEQSCKRKPVLLVTHLLTPGLQGKRPGQLPQKPSRTLLRAASLTALPFASQELPYHLLTGQAHCSPSTHLSVLCYPLHIQSTLQEAARFSTFSGEPSLTTQT